MKITKRNSHRSHYHKRAYQRASISNKHNAASFAKNAFDRGHCPQYYEEKYQKNQNELYHNFYIYLLNKENLGKRAKVYKQWVFIFNSTNNNPTTVYPIPDEFLDVAEIVTIDTKITFKFFNNPKPYEVKTTKSQTSLEHIKRYFAQLNFTDGPFFISKDGTIEKDFQIVGMWRVEPLR